MDPAQAVAERDVALETSTIPAATQGYTAVVGALVGEPHLLVALEAQAVKVLLFLPTLWLLEAQHSQAQ
jgi:hypothetical protein